jgi:anti-anti-sigma factor
LTIRRSETSPFEIRVWRGHGTVDLILAGELDIFGAECLIVAVRELLATEPTAARVTLDLNRVSFVSMSGIRAINTVHEWLTRSGIAVSLPSIPPGIGRAAAAAGMPLRVASVVGDSPQSQPRRVTRSP